MNIEDLNPAYFVSVEYKGTLYIMHRDRVTYTVNSLLHKNELTEHALLFNSIVAYTSPARIPVEFIKNRLQTRIEAVEFANSVNDVLTKRNNSVKLMM